jgi:hypothetical protein
VLGSVLKLLVLKTRYGMFDVGFDASWVLSLTS